MTRQRLGLVLGLALTGGALAQTQGHTGHGMAGGAKNQPMSMQNMNVLMLTELRPLKGRAFDVLFAQRMMDHHQAAIDMAHAELRLGQNARVKAAARRVVAAQEEETGLMGAWVKTWTRRAYTPNRMPLDGPSNNIDRWFLSEMIPHHQGAAEMAKLVPTRTQNPQLRKLAADIIKTQTAEINQYRAWLGSVR